MMCFRGVDNLSYYSLTGPADAPRRYYMNYTGCGNSLNFDSPAGHPAGHGLAAVLVRNDARGRIPVRSGVRARPHGGRLLSGSSASFFDAVSQDPVLNRAILIAEPWDIGTYQVGNFPVDWSEWNGRFRDTMRRFAKSDPGQLAEVGLASHRIGGSLRRGRTLRLQQRQLHHLP